VAAALQQVSSIDSGTVYLDQYFARSWHRNGSVLYKKVVILWVHRHITALIGYVA